MIIRSLCGSELDDLISLSIARSVSSQSIDDPDDDADDESDNNCPQERLTIIYFTSGVTAAIVLLNPRRLDSQENQPYNDNNNDEPQDGPRKITTIPLFLVMVVHASVHAGVHSGLHAR
jgi:hypothetical protein